MIMKICPNCLVGVSKTKKFCHQCGFEINKPRAGRYRKTASNTQSYKFILKTVLWLSLLAIGFVYQDRVIERFDLAMSSYTMYTNKISDMINSHQFQTKMALEMTADRDIDTIKRQSLQARPAAGAP